MLQVKVFKVKVLNAVKCSNIMTHSLKTCDSGAVEMFYELRQ